MVDEFTIGISIIIGAIITYLVILSRRKEWYLETLNPRQQFSLGKEKKLIVNMVINGKQFNGFEAGKYRIILLYGDIATFSKPILRGKIEEMYIQILAESLIGRKLVSRVERLRFLNFIFRRIPSLSTKAYMVTGELVSPQDVLDYCWKETKERDKAFTEMRKRRLIDPHVIWVKPYPPEDKLKEILTGTLMVPDIVMNHVQEYTRVVASQRQTLVEIDQSVAKLLRETIPWQRIIVDSMIPPTQMIGMILADRASKIEGLGLEQITEKGGFESVINAGKILRERWKEFSKVFAEPPKPEEIAKAQAKRQELSEILRRLKEIEQKLSVKPEVAAK